MEIYQNVHDRTDSMTATYCFFDWSYCDATRKGMMQNFAKLLCLHSQFLIKRPRLTNSNISTAKQAMKAQRGS